MAVQARARNIRQGFLMSFTVPVSWSRKYWNILCRTGFITTSAISIYITSRIIFFLYYILIYDNVKEKIFIPHFLIIFNALDSAYTS